MTDQRRAQTDAANEPRFPPYFADLVDRAATLLQSWGCFRIEFAWWADGEDRSFIGALEWPRDRQAPRVVVYDGRSGDFVCQSLEGRMFDIDPELVVVDVAPDEAARWEWRQRQAALRGSSARNGR